MFFSQKNHEANFLCHKTLFSYCLFFFKKKLSVEIINKIIPYWIISRLLFPGENNFFHPVAYRLCGAESFWCFSHVLWSVYCCRPC